MIEKLEKLDPKETIRANVIVTRIDDDYVSYMELEFDPEVESKNIPVLLRELSSGFGDCIFKLDRVIDQL